MSNTLVASPMPSTIEARGTQALAPSPGTAELSWEDRIAELLGELSQVQSDLLQVLGAKSGAMASGDHEVLHHCTTREVELLARLEACHEHRQRLLEAARQEGLPADSVEHLASSIEGPRRHELRQEVTDTRRRMRLLQHQCLTNWVVTQRNLIHLSQMIEIVATGGRMQSTYGGETPQSASAGFVDQQA